MKRFNSVITSILSFVMCCLFVVRADDNHGIIEIHGEQKFCRVTEHSNFLNVRGFCSLDNSISNIESDVWIPPPDSNVPEHLVKIMSHGISHFTFYKATLFSKRNIYAEFEAYECRILKRENIFTRRFFSTRHTTGYITWHNTSLTDCLEMVELNSCLGNEMTCKSYDDTCSWRQSIIANYPSLWGTNKVIEHECSYSRRTIILRSQKDLVDPNALEPCFLNDGMCNLNNGLLYWKEPTIRSCQYERLFDFEDLKMSDEIMNTFYSPSNGYVFKVENKSIECGLDMYDTRQGFKVTFWQHNISLYEIISSLPKSSLSAEHFQPKDQMNLALAENDFKFQKIVKELDKISCSSIINTIRLLLQRNDEYVMINRNGEEMVVYLNGTQAFVPSCINVQFILINTSLISNNGQESKECFEYVSIYVATFDEISKSYSYEKVFLNDAGIVVPTSKSINCKNIKRKVILLKQVLIRFYDGSSTIGVFDYNQTLITNLTTNQSLYEELLRHNKMLTNGTGSINLERLERSFKRRQFKIHNPKSVKEGQSFVDKFSSFINNFARTNGHMKSQKIISFMEWIFIIVGLVILLFIASYCSCIIKILILPCKLVETPIIKLTERIERCGKSKKVQSDIFL